MYNGHRVAMRLQHRLLAAAGWEELGRGAFSKVYGKDGYPWAIKISTEYDGWFDYAVMIMQNGYANHNPLFPRIRKLFAFKRYYVAIIERLDCTISARLRGDDADKRVIAQCDDEQYTLAWNILDDYNFNKKQVRDLDPHFQEFVKMIVSCFGKKPCIDMHLANAMYRGDQLVITDPLYESSSKAEKICWKQRKSRSVFVNA